MINTFLKEIRSEFSADSKFFLGRNRVMAKALGNNKSEEQRPQLSKMAELLSGDGIGLMLTKREDSEI